jgi:hypothetical protein
MIIWVCVQVVFGRIKVAKDFYHIVVRRDLVKFKLLGENLFCISLENWLRISCSFEVFPLFLRLFPVLFSEGFAEELPFLIHFRNLLLNFLLLLFLLEIQLGKHGLSLSIDRLQLSFLGHLQLQLFFDDGLCLSHLLCRLLLPLHLLIHLLLFLHLLLLFVLFRLSKLLLCLLVLSCCLCELDVDVVLLGG